MALHAVAEVHAPRGSGWQAVGVVMQAGDKAADAVARAALAVINAD